MGIVLNYASAMADSRDTGNRSMRAACRTAWSEEDYNASVARLEHLAVVFYRHNVEDDPNVSVDAALAALQETKGQSCLPPSYVTWCAARAPHPRESATAPTQESGERE